MATDKYLSIITGIHFSKSMLRTLNNITFLFDPNWEAGINEIPTLPLCLFHVKSIHETRETQVSQKQLMFYNSQDVETNRSVTGGLTQVVADNVVLQPKTYQLDIIIPSDSLSLIFGNSPLNAYQYGNILSFQAGHDVKVIDKLAVTSHLEFMRNLITAVGTANYTDWKSVLSGTLSTPDYNKNSLEAMVENRSILKLKMWNNWKYKYVTVTHYDISKEPTEDGVYEASITCQEMPIMSVRNTALIQTPLYKNLIVTQAGKIIKRAINGKEE